MNVSDLRNKKIDEMSHEFESIILKILEVSRTQNLKLPLKVKEIDKRINIEISLFSNKDEIFCTRDDFTCLINRFLAKHEYILRRPNLDFIINLMKQNTETIKSLFSQAKQIDQDDCLLLKPIDAINKKTVKIENNDDYTNFFGPEFQEPQKLTELVERNPIVTSRPFRRPEIMVKERPFLCGYNNCTSAFKRLEHLKRHSRIHTGERPFRCNFAGCYKRFARSDNLKQHLKVHNVYLLTRRRK
ncbi:Zinc finger C2H2 protein [Dictyocoela muelleri]|nr:Zinc finger C2H2 protein [Dictyocoela muelleri]